MNTTTKDSKGVVTTPAVTRKMQVVALLNSIASSDTEPMAYIDATRFRQHNLTATDGVEGFAEMINALGMYPEAPRVRVHRVIEDGDYVVTHSEYNLFGEKIGFDIFRYEDGKIVEHWDNLQPRTDTTNPSGRTMIDGSTRICDEKHTETNRAVVEQFVSDVLIGGDYKAMATYFDGDNYKQHNPEIGDGVAALMTAMGSMRDAGVTMTFTHLHRVFCEGNFALAVTEGMYGVNGGAPTCYYDLFRLHDGKIAEHWDVIETILPVAERKNNNGKFGF